MQSARFHPLGYPLEISSGTWGVLDVASEIWAPWPPLFEAPPVRIQVSVHDGEAPRNAPRFSAPPGLLKFCSDGGNYGEFDPAQRRGVVSIAESALESHLFRRDFLEALTLTALDSVFFTPLHAACISRNGVGTLLCGDSGAGKSSLAYACSQRGWTLVSDDAIHLAPGPERMGVGGSSIVRLREPGADPTGEQTIEIDPAANGLSTARSAAVGRCVFLRRRPGPVEWRDFPESAALEYFLKYLFPRDTVRAARQLREFLASPPALLEYENVDDAAAAL
jgi:hypothetical protein